MEFLLICGIVVGAFLLVVYRIMRSLREPAPPCCNCDTCMQPEEVRNACSGNNPPTDNIETPTCVNNQRPPENGVTKEQ